MTEGNWRLGVFINGKATDEQAGATRSRIDGFGINYEAKAGFSTSHFAWSA